MALSEYCLSIFKHFTRNYRTMVQKKRSQELCVPPTQQLTAVAFIPILNPSDKTKWKNRRQLNQPRGLHSSFGLQVWTTVVCKISDRVTVKVARWCLRGKKEAKSFTPLITGVDSIHILEHEIKYTYEGKNILFFPTKMIFQEKSVWKAHLVSNYQERFVKCIVSALMTGAQTSVGNMLCVSYEVGYAFHSLIIFGS